MIEVSDEAVSVLRGSHTMHLSVSSWLGGELLADDIPVSGGSVTHDSTRNVPEAGELVIPRLYRGVSYAPGRDVAHPLACWGQRVRIAQGVQMARGRVEWVRRGWYVITGTQTDGDSVRVSFEGLLTLVNEARFVSPFVPSGTFGSCVRRLVGGSMPVDLTDAPADESVPSGLAYDEDRLAALYAVLDAWGAEAYVSPDGALTVVEAGDSAAAVATFTDGAGGTVMRWGGEVSRDGAANAVVARGHAADGSDVQAVVYDYATSSPARYGGPFNPLPVPFLFSSDLLTTAAMCKRAAATILTRRRRTSSRTIEAEAVPFPPLEARDAVSIEAPDLGIPAGTLGVVDALTMPLTPDGGAMRLAVRVAS